MTTAGHEALQAGREALAAYAKRVKSSTLHKVASGMLSVKRTFADEPQLRRALTDPARKADDRAGLAEQLLSGKVSAGTLKVILTIVKGRWSTPGEFLNAVEEVAVDALLTAGAADDVLADVEDELFRFVRLVEGDDELYAALNDSRADASARAGFVRTLLSDKANELTVRLTEVAAYGYGGRRFDAAVNRLVERAAEKREERVAYVTVAHPLPDAQESALAQKLSQIYQQPVHTMVTVDPEAIGGISVQIGHDLYDGTVARRLTEARKALTGRR